MLVDRPRQRARAQRAFGAKLAIGIAAFLLLAIGVGLAYMGVREAWAYEALFGVWVTVVLVVVAVKYANSDR